MLADSEGSYYNQEEWLEEYYAGNLQRIHNNDCSHDDTEGSESEHSVDTRNTAQEEHCTGTPEAKMGDAYVIICPHVLQAMLMEVSVCRFCGEKLTIIENASRYH